MKRGFTMIELIFVIVILGILAAVAIPKFMATRTDAQVAARGQEVQSAVQEVSNYVTSQGGEANSTELTNMSQVLKQLANNGQGAEADSAASTTGDKLFEVYGANTNKCIDLETNTTALQVKYDSGASSTDQICNGMKKIVKEANYTLAGSSVKF